MNLANIIRDNRLIDEKEWAKHIDSLKKSSKKPDFKKEIIKAVKKRLPEERFGILFSGGIDSTLIAFICNKLNSDFICYTVGLENSPDIIAAEQVAKKYGFKLKKKTFSLKEAEKTIKAVVKIVGPDTMKAGVGSVIYEAAKLAKKDKIKHVFSGIGPEEMFAGYQRYTLSKNINRECWSGLKGMYKRDFERDFAIAKELKINILAPFLESDIIISAMRIPGKEKIKDGCKKYAMRKFAEQLGLKDAWRKRKAAQYGSYFDKAIEKLAKKNKFKQKKNYLNSLFNIGALCSSGKDSLYALYLMRQQDYNIKCLLSIKSKNPDSFMFHTPAVNMVRLQSTAMGIPLIEQATKGEKEKELGDLKKAFKKAKSKYKIDGISTGALFSDYQKHRIEKICDSLELKAFSPLWHFDQEKYMREIIKSGFKFILVKIAADGLGKNWLNKIITEEDVDRLAELNGEIGINIAGEGGEFETLVIDCPLFNKRIKITDFEIKEKNRITSDLVIKEAVLTNKT